MAGEGIEAMSQNSIKDFLSDPKVVEGLEILAPVLPVLGRMVPERAEWALTCLMSRDPSPGLEALREHASDQEWSAVARSIAKEGRAEVLQELQDRYTVRDLLLRAGIFGLQVIRSLTI